MTRLAKINHPKAWLVRIGTLLFVLFALLWILHIPERPDRVFRAMPENSLLVSEHIDLSGVWRRRFDNPLLVDTLSVCGVRHAEDWAADTNIVWIVRLVSGPRSLIGYSPALGPSARPCWTGASWVGPRGRLLNLMLLTRWIPGVGRLDVTPSGVRYMRLKSRKMQGLYLAFRLRENVLMATLGEDPEAVRHLDERLRLDAPLAPVFRHDQRPWERSGILPHRAWVDPAQSPWPLPLPLGDPLEVDLHTIRHDRLGLTLRRRHVRSGHEPPPPMPALTGRCTAADALAGSTAQALLMLPYETLRTLCTRYLPDLSLPSLADRAGGTEDACLYLSAQPYGGCLLNLAVPALTMLLPWRDDTGPDDVRSMLEQVNAASGLDLRTRVPETPSERRLAVDWLAGRRLRLLAGRESMVAEWYPGWLILGSSAISLAAQRHAVGAAGIAWRSGLERRLSGSTGRLQGYICLDLGATADEARQVLAVYRLATAFGMLPAGAAQQSFVMSLGDALENASRLGTLEGAWGEDAEGGLRLEIELGAKAGVPVE